MVEEQGQKSILIVDESENRRHRNSTLLRQASFAVFATPTADLALRMLQEFRPGVAMVADALQPLRGVDLCTALRRTPDGASLPIVVLTRDDDPTARATAFGAGADDVIADSVPPEELLVRVRRLSDRKVRTARVTEHEKLAAVFRVAHTIRHGICNPLQVIEFGLEMLSEKLSADTESIELLHTMSGNVGRVRQLMERLGHLTELRADPSLSDPNILDVFDPEAVHIKRLKLRGAYRVLVVEDDASQRLVATSVLARTGQFQVQEAASGEEALEMARLDPPDVLLTDINMPGVNGFELLAKVKADPELSHMVVIMFTVRQSLRDMIRCCELGAANYLLKPINADRLVEHIYRTLGYRGYAQLGVG